MLDANLTAQLRTYLEKVTLPIELSSSLDDSPASAELAELLDEIAALSPLITVTRRDDDARRPSFAIQRVGTDVSVRFAGIPLGHEFTSLVLALLQVGGHPPAIEDDLATRIASLPGEHLVEIYFSLTCQNCPDVVQGFNTLSVLNPSFKVVSIDGAKFQAEVDERKVMAVPTVFVDGEMFESGRMTLGQIVDRLDDGADERIIAELEAKDDFDVLIVGGGPAGASAAIYAARKGLATGVVTERFGGQVLDTMSIENLISVPHTEGPKLATALEQHVREYDVDIMDRILASKVIPASQPGGLIEVELANGASLKSRTVVLSTGARWRSMNVPGEQEYRNKGVTYCPHCDGPLFKGKAVAVIGGGNSGLEAAIDLAGVVKHVTLIEFDTKLRADEVLQAKFRSLPNTEVILNAMTTEVVGNGESVTGLIY
ncbi:MAG: alkyl hydroperoxide reductase subunit F, partial [Acidimicrobiales bacterium]|nr:alkyl hydroperoxide reductase subunit F [Acidimicrobiales bacterium]